MKNVVGMIIKVTQLNAANVDAFRLAGEIVRLAVRRVLEQRLQLVDLGFERMLELDVVEIPGNVGQVRHWAMHGIEFERETLIA